MRILDEEKSILYQFEMIQLDKPKTNVKIKRIIITYINQSKKEQNIADCHLHRLFAPN